MSATPRLTDPVLPDPPVLYLALAFSTGPGQSPRLRTVPARDLDALGWRLGPRLIGLSIRGPAVRLDR